MADDQPPPSDPPADPPAQPMEPTEPTEPQPSGRGLSRLRRTLSERRHRDLDAMEANLERHWAQVREDEAQRAKGRLVPSINSGPSDLRPARVPYGVDLAAAWGWRFLVIVAAGGLIFYVLGHFMTVVLPVVVALFLAALFSPVVDLLARGMKRGAATLLVVFAALAVIVTMLSFATQQVVNGSNDLADQVVSGLDKIRKWLQDGPLNLSDKQLNDAIDNIQHFVTSKNAEIAHRAGEVGATVGHIVAGIFIVLFSTYFFLSDGRGIWAWVVRIFPRAARAKADQSGQVAWASLTQFVRATVLVAFVDAVGVMIVAAILKVPFVLAIGVLVFLGAFVPLVGAFISGTVAVLVALVAHGPIVALIMLGGLIGVQQLEAHILQPFLLGRMVRVHPLAVILSIALGVELAGIPGALVAVPLAATVNAVATYLAAESAAERREIEEEVDAEPEPTPGSAQ